MRQFIVLAVIGFIAAANANSYKAMRNRYRCYGQADVRDCPYGQVLNDKGCRLDRCYKSCTEEIYCNVGTVSKRINGQCVCEDSATACPANDCDFRPAEDLLLNPPCDKFLVDQKTGCEICECDCQRHGGECRDMNCRHGQLHRDDGCRLCECRTCEDLDCNMNCEFGYEKDVFGCDTCTCKPNPACPTKTCEYGFKKDHRGRSTCECACRPECDRDCQYGFERDNEGCPLCRCACPPIDNCDLDCEFGYYHEGDCPKCQCKPNPQCPDLECPFGYRKNSAGNSLCHCLPNPDCPDKSCSNGFVLGSDGIPTCECKCGPGCLIDCPYGIVLDGEDCPTCDCNPPPCPVCGHNCKYGFVPGSNDCNTCDCKPAPVHDGMCPKRLSSRGDSCHDDGDCDRDEKCCSRGNSRAKCQEAVIERSHGGKCPHFILLDLTSIAASHCYSDSQCGYGTKCCNVGGVKRCITTGAAHLTTGGHHRTPKGTGYKTRHQ